MQVDINGTVVELTEKQIELYDDLSDNEKTFALCKLCGMRNREAYQLITDSTNWAAIDASAARMLGRAKIRLFLNSCQQLRFGHAIMERNEMAARLSALARTNPGDILTIYQRDDVLQNPETGEMVQGQTHWTLKELQDMTGAGLDAISELSVGAQGIKVKFTSQLQAKKQLADLMGYNKPQQLEVSVAKSLNDLYDEFEAQDENATSA